MSDKWANRLLTFWACVIVSQYASTTFEGIRQGWNIWQFVAAYLGLVFVIIEAVAAVLVFALIVMAIYYGVNKRKKEEP